MRQEEVVKEVNRLMTEGFEVPANKLTRSATLFKDLGLDSLDAVDLMVHLEEKLKVKVDAERMASIRTMDDVYKLVSDLASQQEAPPLTI